ncbi:hypothetical protein vseg_017288 [Gypsophila vaccaria]
MVCNKKPRISYRVFESKSMNPFDKLPDDLLISILSNLSSSSSSPSHFINALLVCKRFNRLGLNRVVLSKTCSNVLGLKAKKWCESAHRFLKLCVDAGSVDAYYFLGMIRFYCLESKRSGASLMAKAAIKGHAPALYSLAVIQFNGSGGAKCNRDLRSGVALCARAACFGHVDAFRELGHCLQDGYGIAQNIPAGRRLLIQANARELASALPYVKSMSFGKSKNVSDLVGSGCGSLMSDFGCNVPVLEPHPANRFLVEWFGIHGPGQGLRLCSHYGCGRPETRPHEFRRCSVCGAVNYCSRGCQAMDWKMRHKMECSQMGSGPGQGQWIDVGPQLGVVVGAPMDQHHEVVS